MIKFTIVIEEQKSGFVAVRSETPPGVASPREIDLGLKLKQLVKELAERAGAKITDWKAPHNENRADN